MYVFMNSANWYFSTQTQTFPQIIVIFLSKIMLLLQQVLRYKQSIQMTTPRNLISEIDKLMRKIQKLRTLVVQQCDPSEEHYFFDVTQQKTIDAVITSLQEIKQFVELKLLNLHPYSRFSEEQYANESAQIQTKIFPIKEREREHDEIVEKNYQQEKDLFYNSRIKSQLIGASVQEQAQQRILSLFNTAKSKNDQLSIEIGGIGNLSQNSDQIIQLKQLLQLIQQKSSQKQKECPPIMRLMKQKSSSVQLIRIQYFLCRYQVSAFDLFEIIHHNKRLYQVTIKGVQVHDFQRCIQLMNPKNSQQQPGLSWIKDFDQHRPIKLAINARLQFDLSNAEETLRTLDDLAVFEKKFDFLGNIEVIIKLGEEIKISEHRTAFKNLIQQIKIIKAISIHIKGENGWMVDQSFSIVFKQLASLTDIAQLSFENIHFCKKVSQDEFITMEKDIATIFSINQVTFIKICNCSNFPIFPKDTNFEKIVEFQTSFRKQFDFKRNDFLMNPLLIENELKGREIQYQGPISDQMSIQLDELKKFSFELSPNSQKGIWKSRIQSTECFTLIIFTQIFICCQSILMDSFPNQIQDCSTRMNKYQRYVKTRMDSCKRKVKFQGSLQQYVHEVVVFIIDYIRKQHGNELAKKLLEVIYQKYIERYNGEGSEGRKVLCMKISQLARQSQQFDKVFQYLKQNLQLAKNSKEKTNGMLFQAHFYKQIVAQDYAKRIIQLTSQYQGSQQNEFNRHNLVNQNQDLDLQYGGFEEIQSSQNLRIISFEYDEDDDFINDLIEALKRDKSPAASQENILASKALQSLQICSSFSADKLIIPKHSVQKLYNVDDDQLLLINNDNRSQEKEQLVNGQNEPPSIKIKKIYQFIDNIKKIITNMTFFIQAVSLQVFFRKSQQLNIVAEKLISAIPKINAQIQMTNYRKQKEKCQYPLQQMMRNEDIRSISTDHSPCQSTISIYNSSSQQGSISQGIITDLQETLEMSGKFHKIYAKYDYAHRKDRSIKSFIKYKKKNHLKIIKLLQIYYNENCNKPLFIPEHKFVQKKRRGFIYKRVKGCQYQIWSKHKLTKSLLLLLIRDMWKSFLQLQQINIYQLDLREQDIILCIAGKEYIQQESFQISEFADDLDRLRFKLINYENSFILNEDKNTNQTQILLQLGDTLYKDKVFDQSFDISKEPLTKYLVFRQKNKKGKEFQVKWSMYLKQMRWQFIFKLITKLIQQNQLQSVDNDLQILSGYVHEDRYQSIFEYINSQIMKKI